MKSRKKIFTQWILSLTMVMLGMFICSLNVKADVIWEPMDSFYESHRDECEYVNRKFTANGPDGKIIVYKSPEDPAIVVTLENDTQFGVSFTYEDKKGISWAIYENFENGNVGWVPLDYLTVVYDYISFEEEFGDQIKSEEGQLDSSLKGKEVYFWNCPGSPEGYTCQLGEDYFPEYRGTYIDEIGRKWGYCSYYYGHKNKWICLDEPTADYASLYPNGGPQLGEDEGNSVTESSDAVKEEVSGETAETNQEIATAPGSNRTERIVPGGTLWPTVLCLCAVVMVTICITLILLKKLKDSK